MTPVDAGQVPSSRALCSSQLSVSLRLCLQKQLFNFNIFCVWVFWGGSLFALETSVFREPEGMSEPALKDRSMTIFWNSVPYLHAFRLWAPEADHWVCTSGLIKGQIPHLRTGQLGRHERDWILYLHTLQMPVLCRIGLIWRSKRCVSHVSFSA